MFVPDLKASRSSSMDVPSLNPGLLGNQVSMGLGRVVEITSSTCLFVFVFLSFKKKLSCPSVSVFISPSAHVAVLKVKVIAKVQNVSERLSGQYLLTLLLTNWI